MFANKNVFLLLISFALVFTACEKEEIATPLADNQEMTINDAASLVAAIEATAAENFQEPGEPAEVETRSGCTTILDLALATPDLSILVAAASRIPGLPEALDIPAARLTVFAPTNQAFEAFLRDNGFSSLDEVPQDVLATVLANHLLAGRFPSGRLHTGYFRTLANSGFRAPLSLYAQRSSTGITLNGNVNVIDANNVACKSLVHVVDRVIALPNILTFALSNPEFSTLVAALTRPDLSTDFVAALSGNGPFTVVAPTNAAFRNLLASNPAWRTLNDIPAALLETVLKYHVSADGNLRVINLRMGVEVNTLAEATFFAFRDRHRPAPSIRIRAGSNFANVVIGDVQGTNGVIHAIDTVILP